MKKMLVCGATGFIGRNMLEHFARSGQYEVHGTYLDSEPFQLDGVKMVRADLRDSADVNRVVAGMDVVVQAAATTSGAKDIVSRPYIHVTDNAVMNSLIFRAAFEQKVGHLIFFSCTVMYQSGETPLKETDFDANREMYPSYFGGGWTKVYLEKMCEFYARLGSTRFTVARHSNIYGPHDKYDLDKSHVFGATMTKVLTARDKVVVWGAGEERRDLLYVSDLVRFVELALQKQQERFALYNVGLGQAIAIRDLVRQMVAASGRPLAIEHDLSKPSLKTALCLDCSKARQELGWAPDVSLEQGIARTMAWYRETLLDAA
jgi:GDP-L-fucose synthase